jgi:phosphatidylinositol-3-phosphatase
VMENEEAGNVIASKSAPYANSLARRYGLATRSFAVAHPSLPNYLALTSGATDGIASDCTSCHVGARNIVDQLEAAHVSWRAYLEDQPRACFAGASSAGYAKKHNPFIYYDDVARDPRRCHRLVGFGELSADLRADRLPTFVWITPNLCDDGHDCGVGAGDRFLSRTVPLLLREIGPHGFLVLTWDEGTTDDGCCAGAAAGGHIATIVAGPDVRPHAVDAQAVDHYGVLQTIEQALDLPPLARAANAANGTLAPLFQRPPRVR